MPTHTPREKLIEAVQRRFRQDGFEETAVVAMSLLAVDAFYADNHEHPHFPLVAETAMRLVMDIIPPFVTHMYMAFEQVQQAMQNVTEAARVAGPWAELAQRLNKVDEANSTTTPRFDASGLPVDVNPEFDARIAPADRQGEPCIEDGCGNPAVPGTAFCAACMPQATEQTAILHMVAQDLARDAEVPTELLDVAGEVSLEDTGRRAIHFQPYQRQPGETGPTPMFQGEVQPPPPDVIELTEREWHLSAARSLRRLGCTYQQLKRMAERGVFPSGRHHSLWFNVGNLVNLEQLDRANFVLDNLIRGDAFDIDMDDAAIQRAEAHYPEDRLTGAPHHFIVNGDHSGCGCGGHSTTCEVWDESGWHHVNTICNITRTHCTHRPRHRFGEKCPDYLGNGDSYPVAGLTDTGEEVRGPAAG